MSSNSSTSNIETPPTRPLWVRGVNLGGWLVMERYITPYQFAVTDCHVKGDFCWYPGQLSAPPKHHEDYKVCDLLAKCKPIRTRNKFGNVDYPLDEWTLAQAFDDRQIASDWLDYHLEHFVQESDLHELVKAGVTHVRVPMPHFILEPVNDASAIESNGEPWVPGNRWKYFVRFCKWARTAGLQVWPDIHTAPGSQNGFDNSGQALLGITCQGWSNNATHVERSLQAIRDITAAAVRDGIDDVVTGFGLLNEPFKDCDRKVAEQFMEDGLQVVHDTLGRDTSVYVSDLFLAKTFNHNGWWLDPVKYNNTYLDSHYYHVFADEPRALSPRQHIGYVCQNEYRDTISCCYDEWPHQNRPSSGVKRMVGEWSAAYDTLPVAMLVKVMDGIAETGVAPFVDREMSQGRKDFLLNFVEAQMVAYEAVEVGTSGAWFYWTMKMEGGAFAEWDFLRGVREGWIPQIPAPDVTSESVHGTCYDIIFRTNDSMSIIEEFPDPATLPKRNWQGVKIDDDVVVSHGNSLLDRSGGRRVRPEHHGGFLNWLLVASVALFVGVAFRYLSKRRRKMQQYDRVNDTEEASIAV